MNDIKERQQDDQAPDSLYNEGFYEKEIKGIEKKQWMLENMAKCLIIGLIAYVKSVAVNLAVYIIWAAVKAYQYGNIQTTDRADNIVWSVYLIIIFLLFLQAGLKKEEKRRERGQERKTDTGTET